MSFAGAAMGAWPPANLPEWSGHACNGFVVAVPPLGLCCAASENGILYGNSDQIRIKQAANIWQYDWVELLIRSVAIILTALVSWAIFGACFAQQSLNCAGSASYFADAVHKPKWLTLRILSSDPDFSGKWGSIDTQVFEGPGSTSPEHPEACMALWEAKEEMGRVTNSFRLCYLTLHISREQKYVVRTMLYQITRS